MTRVAPKAPTFSTEGLVDARSVVRDGGLTLLSVLLWLLLLSSLALFLSARIASHAIAIGDAERQLYSLVQAGNGIEYARAVLPALDVNRLLDGLDGVRQDVDPAAEPRNPMTLEEAHSLDPRMWIPSRDDGLPWAADGILLPRGYWAENSGYFFLRFSNDPEEGDGPDQDGVVIVRSMGVAPSRFIHPFFPSVRNSVSIVEARLRQERVFDLPGPVALFGETGEFQWDGERFSVEGGDLFAISMVVASGGTLLTDLLDSLTPAQQLLVRGGGVSPSIRNVTESFRQDPSKNPVFSPRFWEHFLENLSDFADRLEGLRYYPRGGVLEGLFEGVLLAKGDLTLRSARIEGLLIHLGEGKLILTGDSVIVGGLWLSNVQPLDELASGPLRLQVSERVQVRYDPTLLRQAVSRFPTTQLGCRIIFPEMAQ